MNNLISTLLVALTFSTIGCAHGTIEGTSVPDTEENRAVLEVLTTFRSAMQERDADKIIALVASDYFEDMGTIDQADDYGYKHLIETVIPSSLQVAQEVYLTFEIHNIEVDGDSAWADVRYNSRAKLGLSSGDLWETHKDFNRIEFSMSEAGRWVIKAGL
jgi:hypothetical protein